MVTYVYFSFTYCKNIPLISVNAHTTLSAKKRHNLKKIINIFCALINIFCALELLQYQSKAKLTFEMKVYLRQVKVSFYTNKEFSAV